MSERPIPEAVIESQHAASDPAASAFVVANAGAGKTHVLAQRVIRLLLDGTEPTKILCLTFTKAAAANMANRIFDTLAQWIELSDDKLDAAIRSTGVRDIDAKRRAQARRLFASALETPGGLKVQTIHGFCTRLLQQFPFEANVAARFRVLEEAEQSQLIETIRREVLLQAAQNPDSAIGRALTSIIPTASDLAFQLGLDEALRERNMIGAWLDHVDGLNGAQPALSAALGIEPGDTMGSVEAEIVYGPHMPFAEWRETAAICAEGSKNDRDQGERLTSAASLAGAARVDIYRQVFLTADDDPRKTIITDPLVRRYPELARRLKAEQDRVCVLCDKRRAVLARDRTLALLTIAVEVIGRYAADKNRRGQLDYDDLISHTQTMLDRFESAWVHYKLDLGIDHLLIDEAQDTSPQQWDIIKKLVAEFTSGAGARSGVWRSIFAVGDDKQSIFSFQDAAPEAFDETRRFFESAHSSAGLPFRSIPFHYSFRSVPVVLDAVDAVFRQPSAHAGLTADPVPTVHAAVRAAAPGLVELWPLIEADGKPELDAWDAPFDTQSETSPRVKLARQIAAAVKTWINRRDLVGDGPQRHPVQPGDILILVRQRGPLFEAIIRALKNTGIAVAGADRLVLTEHIAVMDLMVLADALLLPDDDLALATVLKSPLFGLSEQELYDLAQPRKGALFRALHEQRSDLAQRFDALREAAQRLSPFAFYAQVLGRDGGRRAFLDRLGIEANDAIDEFLNLALVYESREAPSLQGFVAWLRTASAEVKRDMEIARNEVRVMTVHGAKGLEAPVVVLADTTTLPAGPPNLQAKLLKLPAPNAAPETPAAVVWAPRKPEDANAMAAARAAAVALAENEYRRLLYVAMTRAADRLVVCGSVGERTSPPGCWYRLVEQGLAATGELIEEDGDFSEGKVRRYRKSAPEAATADRQALDAAELPLFPPWLTRPVEDAPVRAAPLTPSSFADKNGAATSPNLAAARQQALQRGVLVHRLMQALPDIPAEHRRAAALRHLARAGKDFSAAEHEAMIEQVLAVLAEQRFAALFTPGSRAEISIAGRVGAHTVSGQVDRLAIAPDAVLIADYKTNRPAPRKLADVPPAYVRQLALYRAVLGKLYPERPVRAALVWTETLELMEIPTASLDAALACLTEM